MSSLREYGDTAVVCSGCVGRPVKGQTVEFTYRLNDVFVQRDGRWQCVSSQSTRVVAR